MATALLNCGCTAGSQETGKFTLPSLPGSPAGCSCWATAGVTNVAQTAAINTLEIKVNRFILASLVAAFGKCQCRVIRDGTFSPYYGSRPHRSQVRHEGSRTPGVRSRVSAEVYLVRKISERVLGIAPESRVTRKLTHNPSPDPSLVMAVSGNAAEADPSLRS